MQIIVGYDPICILHNYVENDEIRYFFLKINQVGFEKQLIRISCVALANTKTTT